MTLPSSPGPTTAANPTLACVSCAKSKARCDRKAPCTRCVRKKLNCQTRFSQRGVRRLSGTRAAHPDSIGTTSQAGGGGGGDGGGDGTDTHKTSQSTNGIWMDWSHRFDARFGRTIDHPKDLAETTRKDDFLAQLVAAAVSGAGDKDYPPPLSASARPDHSSMAPFMDPSGVVGDLFDFVAHSSSSSPTPQIALEGAVFTFSPSALMAFASNSDAMDDYAPAVHFQHSVDMEPASHTCPDSDDIEFLEGWPLFRCNPVASSAAYPFTAAAHVKNLYSLLTDDCMATSERRPPASNTAIEPLLPTTREKITGVLQGLYYEAQQLYGLRSQDHGLQVLTMPPPSEMDFLFRAYMDCCEPFYPLVRFSSLKINESIESSRTILPSISLLLMMATGALAAGAGKKYSEIAHGLLDICRTSLRRLIEQNIKLASDPDLVLCAWLLIFATVWSGDKWQMDLGIYQKAMYLEMHLRSGLHKSREDLLASLDPHNDAVHNWELWKQQEALNRSTYSWLILDYELCLFQDVPSATFLSVMNLDLPIPSPDATLASTWGRHTDGIPPSLREWVRCFTNTNDIGAMDHVTRTTLRLLLCHLMDQVLQLRSRIDSIQAGSTQHHHHHKSSRQPFTVLLSVQVHEIQELLQKWFEIAQARCPDDTPANCANTMLYHLVVLNTMVSVPEIERLARQDKQSSHSSSTKSGSSPLSSTTTSTRQGPRSALGRVYHLDAEDAREIYFHCGQALRNIHLVPETARPPWWAGVVYRVALIAWANSMAHQHADVLALTSQPPRQDGWHKNEMDSDAPPLLEQLRLDALSARDPTIVAYLNHQAGSGSPVFSNASGGTVSVADSVGVLRHCAKLLESDVKTKFTHGIQQKLMTMARRWES